MPSACARLPAGSTCTSRAESASACTSPAPSASSRLAAARPGETRCFLLDEPTASLDLAHQSLVLAAIRAQARLGVAVVAVFHDLNLAATLADDLVLLERARVMATGNAAAVMTDDLLSRAYGCRVLTNRRPRRGPLVRPAARSFHARAAVGGGPLSASRALRRYSTPLAFEENIELC